MIIDEILKSGDSRQKIHLTTEAQSPQRGAIFLCLSGDVDKHKSLSFYQAMHIYWVPVQKTCAYINVQNIPKGTNSFYPVVVSRPDTKYPPLCSLCLRGEKSVS